MNTIKIAGKITAVLAVVMISCGAITEVRAGRISFTDIRVFSSCDGTAKAGSRVGELSKVFNGICSTDITFKVRDSADPKPLFQDFMESVDNFSRQTWTDFHMQLGFGFGVDFKPISEGCVSFKEPDTAMSDPVKRPQGGNSTRIDWGGATLFAGSRGTFSFTLNVPDSAKCPGAPPDLRGYEFTLRETPTTTTPEPATVLLLSTGLAGFAIKMRKRFKTRKRAQRSQ